MGAQFLLEMRARRSRRALSISAMYSASTTGADIAAENLLLCGSRGSEAGRYSETCNIAEMIRKLEIPTKHGCSGDVS